MKTTVMNPVKAFTPFDDTGLDIAWNARRYAARLGLPVIQPATEVHRLMLASAQAFGHVDGWPSHERRSDADRCRAVEILDIEIRERVERLLRAGRRIPEEVLGPTELRDGWMV
jgi:hypothetical protein